MLAIIDEHNCSVWISDKDVNTRSCMVIHKGQYNRMKNCVNCDHYGVCETVHERKVTKANDYSPCEHWKLVEM